MVRDCFMVIHLHGKRYMPRSKEHKKVKQNLSYFDLEVKGQGQMEVMMVCDKPSHGDTHKGYKPRSKQKVVGLTLKYCNKSYFDLEIKGQG